MIMDSSTKQLFAYSLTMMLLFLPSLAFAQAQITVTLPNLTGGETGQATQEGASGDNAIYCRPPQQRADSRVPGPKVCLTVGKWKELRANGQDVSADGRSIVPNAETQFQASPQLSGRQ
ncbi:MAG TPA: hypothetical protein VNW15_00485 [Rhizomicrobium sp.]|jgi:hypothetical protein|nr:hypothetical protein [Rhizomicrobium sp.]